MTFPWNNTYSRLPDRFFARVHPTPVRAPRLIRLNHALAAQLGLDPEALAAAAPEILSGNVVPDDFETIAMAYAGHQFGHFVPQLGDGRAILLGEVIGTDNLRRDIQLKGSGRTPFSRGGDGRAALGPVLREYIVSEAMHAFGIPTTRALAAVFTGEPVWRETPQPGAVFTRVAASHIRVGTFQFFAARRDLEAVRTLADYVINRHYPDCAQAENPYIAMFDAIAARQAALIAKWMHVGFIHGVMNTDNMAISGETIDFGPCAFMDDYHPGQKYSSIDHQGRYAFSNQPRIAQWNLARLAETLLELFHPETDAAVKIAEASLEKFAKEFEANYTQGLMRKLGLTTTQPGDDQLAKDLFEEMDRASADFTLTVRNLATCDFPQWQEKYRARLATEPTDPTTREAAMRQVNPAFIPRNHLIEEAIQAAVNQGDFKPFHTLVDILARPFDDQPDYPTHAQPPRPDQVVLQTFCGT